MFINVIALYLLGNILRKLGKDNLTFSILFFSTLGGASFYYLFDPTSLVPLLGANCASFGLLAFVLSEELINRLRSKRSIYHVTYVLLTFIFAHILYFYAFSAILSTYIIWQAHFGAFIVGAALALMSQKAR